jgi:hypothetical protein
MQNITHFTKHGKKRTNQRTAISKNEVAMLLDRKFYLNVGKIPGINKEFLLFYSPPDALCYLAVRNPLTGAVITFLPVNYQGCTGWVITEAMCQRVREKTLNSNRPEMRSMLLRDHTKHDEIKKTLEEIEVRKSAAKHRRKARRKELKAEKNFAQQKLVNQSKFEIKLSYFNSENKRRSKIIGRILSEKYDNDFEKLLSDSDFYTMIDEMVVEKKIDAIRYNYIIINIRKNEEIRSHLIEFS